MQFSGIEYVQDIIVFGFDFRINNNNIRNNNRVC